MYSKWHHLIPDNTPEKSGIIIDALQRYLQFDIYAGVIPAGAIDKLFTEKRIAQLATQASNFYHKHHLEIDPLSQHEKEEMIRAHLCGIIKLPIPSHDHWKHSYSELHKQNRMVYEKLSTIGRVELLLQDHPDANIIAASIDKHFAKEGNDYTPNKLIYATLLAIEYYNENRHALETMKHPERIKAITDELTQHKETAW